MFRSSVRMFLVAVHMLMPTTGSPATEPDAFAPVHFLLGTWIGAADGEPGSGTAQRAYTLELGGKFIHERNQTTYPPQTRNPKGEVHEHWSLIGYDNARKLLTFRQFHQEGFVATYVMIPSASSASRIVFESEQLENIGAAWRARETYEVISPDEFTETFELSQAGKPFEIYSRTRFKRERR